MLNRRRIFLGLAVALIIAEALSGWARHKLGYQLAVAGYTGPARFIYASLWDPLALNNYAVLLDIGAASISNRAERQRIYRDVSNLYDRAAAQGVPAAELNAGLLTYRMTRPKSPERTVAKDWLREAADRGDTLAALAYARDLSYLIASPEYPERMSRLRSLADQGIAEAQELYGTALRSTDEGAAVPYLRMAAQQGHYLAIEELGLILLRTDEEEARAWLQKAAEGGSIIAQHALGEIYMEAGGGELYDSQAVYWLSMAADKTNVRKDARQTLYFLDASGFRCCLTIGGALAVINNDIEAAYQLAELYVLGRGGERDLNRARELYARAADVDWRDSKERLSRVEAELAKSQ